MAENITLAKPFSIDMPDGSTRTWPAGWSGRMGTTLAARAHEAGCTVPAPAPDPETPPAASPAPEPVSAALSRAELDDVARERGIDPGAYRTKAELVAALNG